MKKVGIVIAFLLGTCSSMMAQQRVWKDLRGRWEASDGSGIEIVDSTRIFLFYKDEKKTVSNFTTDLSKTPGWFDFTVKDSSEEHRVQSLMHFISDDLVQWQIFEGQRPTNFDPSREVIFLRRKN